MVTKICQCIQTLTKTAKVSKILYTRLAYIYCDLSPWLVLKIGTCVPCEVRTQPEEIVCTIETLRSLWGYNGRWRQCFASDIRWCLLKISLPVLMVFNCAYVWRSNKIFDCVCFLGCTHDFNARSV